MSERLTLVISRTRSGPTSHRVLENELVEQLARREGVNLWIVPHLYDLAPASRAWELLRSADGPMAVLTWLYPRAAFWVLDANGVSGRLGATSTLPPEQIADQVRSGASRPDRTIWCIDLRAYRQAEEVVGEVDSLCRQASIAVAAVGQRAETAEEIAEQTAARWYPVLDYARCTGCLECLNFCLFGVYDLSAGQGVTVQQPDACRNGCPACARICPERAIMFPEHDDPAIAGDPTASHEPFGFDGLAQLLPVQNAAELAAMERRHALAREPKPEGSSAAGAGAREVPQGSSVPEAEQAHQSQSASDWPDHRAVDDSPAQRPEELRGPADPVDRLVDEIDQWDM